jgi:hypothetical protein
MTVLLLACVVVKLGGGEDSRHSRFILLRLGDMTNTTTAVVPSTQPSNAPKKGVIIQPQTIDPPNYTYKPQSCEWVVPSPTAAAASFDTDIDTTTATTTTKVVTMSPVRYGAQGGDEREIHRRPWLYRRRRMCC